MRRKSNKICALTDELTYLNQCMIDSGLNISDLRRCAINTPVVLKAKKSENISKKHSRFKLCFAVLISVLACLLASSSLINYVISYVLGIRCFLPNHYLVWEATRPISDCSFCEGVTKPTILYNATKEEFKKYAYTSGPIIVKGAIKHWKAMQKFDYRLFKELYEHTAGAYESVEQGCQFLHFKTDLFSLREVFSMPQERAYNERGQEPWYVGWGNCHPGVSEVLRQYYTYPEFLPDDAELPSSENVFFGYEQGAVMHIDYIPRLMWQGQIRGNKTWSLAPTPECDSRCQPFQFYVEPGDAVLLDTRIWFHATSIPRGQFSLTIQSEYG